jgi:AcrR family transcriptional regulator
VAPAGRPRSTETRERLLEATLAYAAEHGITDVSFRELARALGTTHRMLGYHFGSKEGLLVAVVQRVEERQRDALTALLGDERLGVDEQIDRMSEVLSDPAQVPNERLLLELYGQAVQGRHPAVELFPQIVTAWIDPLQDLAGRLGFPDEDRDAAAHLVLAVSRGLLLDYLATGDVAAAGRAGELFRRLLRARRDPG